MSTEPPGQDRRAVRHPAHAGLADAAELAHRPRVAVVGGGIAGLAAATCLAERGVAVRLLESEPHLGGRVGGWPTTLADGSESAMDRGFHAFFRQYYNLRALLRRADPQLRGLVPLPDYPLVHRDGHRDTFAGLPRTPLWNALSFVARSPTFRWRDVPRLGTRAALPLADVRVPRTYRQLDHRDAAGFLDDIRFPRAAQHLAFEVFSRSFFAAPEQLSAAELATMFHIYFLGSSEGLLFDVAADSFPAALWDPLQRYLEGLGVRVSTGAPVASVERDERGFRVHLPDDACEVDGVVLATDVGALQDLVTASPELGGPPWREQVARQRVAAPFLVSRFWLDRPVRPERHGFLGTSGYDPVDNVSVLDRYDRTAADWASRNGGSVVELHSYALPGSPSVDALREPTLARLREIYPETAGAGIVDERHELRQDCPLLHPGGFADRLPVVSPDPALTVAGDHARIDLPVALMERAATTGMQAANALLSRWGLEGHALWTVPDRGRYAPLRALAGRLDGQPR